MKIHGFAELTRAATAGALAVVLAACSNEPPKSIVRISEASPLTADGTSLPPVALPHHRRSDDSQASAIVAYRIALPSMPSAALSRGLGVFINTGVPISVFAGGVFVYQNGDADSSPIQIWKGSAQLRIPRTLLNSDENALVVQVHDRSDALRMLGPVYVGDPATIERWAMREWLVNHLGPLLVGAALIGVGIVAMTLWRGRRDSQLFLLLAGGALMWGLRALLLEWPTQLLPRRDFTVLYVSMYVWSYVLLAVFFARFAYTRWRLYEVGAAAFAILTPVALYLAISLKSIWSTFVVLHGVTPVWLAIALFAVLRHAWQERSKKGALLLVVGTIYVAFAVHDHLVSVVGGNTSVILLTNYSGLGLVVLASWMLVDRYHQVHQTTEAMNLDLERRVKAANAELAQQLEQVQAARIEAERASLAKSRFFAAASHDLRQPLHSLGFFAAALNQHAQSQEARDLVARIGDSIVALESLFNELLDLSKLDAGAIGVQRRNVSLQELFDRLSGEFHAQAVKQELRMRFVPTKLLAYTDPILLERILLNLVSNALRYTARGGVTIGARRRGDQVCVEVWDSGIGIPEDRQSQIFDEFYQVGNPGRDRRHGLGLGLAIVRRLTVLLGHELTLTSAPGQGTRFRLWLPRVEGAAEPLVTPAEHHLPDTFAGKRVLLVDDDPDIRLATATLLGQWGLAVRTAASIQEVDVVLAAGFVPELAVVDLRLEAVDDGIDLIERLRNRLGPMLPALLLSGDTGAAEIARVRASGIPLLTKPVSAARLKSVLHSSFEVQDSLA